MLQTEQHDGNSALSREYIPYIFFRLVGSVVILRPGFRRVPAGSASGWAHADLAELCEQRHDDEDRVEGEEEDAVGPAQVEPAQGHDDKGQNQRQSQRTC